MVCVMKKREWQLGLVILALAALMFSPMSAFAQQAVSPAQPQSSEGDKAAKPKSAGGYYIEFRVAPPAVGPTMPICIQWVAMLSWHSATSCRCPPTRNGTLRS